MKNFNIQVSVNPDEDLQNHLLTNNTWQQTFGHLDTPHAKSHAG